MSNTFSSVSAQDFLAVPLASSPGLVDRGTREAVIQTGDPGAIGNGKPLINLVKNGKKGLPKRIPVKSGSKNVADAVRQTREALDLAIKLAVKKSGAVRPGQAILAKEALDNLYEFERSFAKKLYLYNAADTITGPEDYLLGFNYGGKIGLSVELIDILYNISPLRLAQYVYHECVPERSIIFPSDGAANLDRLEHQRIYKELQSDIFGVEEVLELKKDLRSFIEPCILILNCGSSTVKYQVLNARTWQVVVKGNKGTAGRGHAAVLKEILESLKARPIAVGHRVVHGGNKYSKSVLIDGEVEAEIKRLFELAPLHNPPADEGIQAAKACLPGVPQIAVFDTAFHQTMPIEDFLYAVPLKFCEKYGLRRFGFHGTSHRYVYAKAVDWLKKMKKGPYKNGKANRLPNVITVHLGNGSSISAVRNGKCIFNSMGLTPLQGLIMGTRSGDIDPALLTKIVNDGKFGLTIQDVDQILNKDSGMLGVSGMNSDCWTLESAAYGYSARFLLKQFTDSSEKGTFREMLAALKGQGLEAHDIKTWRDFIGYIENQTSKEEVRMRTVRMLAMEYVPNMFFIEDLASLADGKLKSYLDGYLSGNTYSKIKKDLGKNDIKTGLNYMNFLIEEAGKGGYAPTDVVDLFMVLAANGHNVQKLYDKMLLSAMGGIKTALEEFAPQVESTKIPKGIYVYLLQNSDRLGYAREDVMDIFFENIFDGGNMKADLALRMFISRVMDYIHLCYGKLGTCDAIVLTGGIGETKNKVSGRIIEKIQYFIRTQIKPDKAPSVRQIPTNEELVIAQDTMSIVRAEKDKITAEKVKFRKSFDVYEGEARTNLLTDTDIESGCARFRTNLENMLSKDPEKIFLFALDTDIGSFEGAEIIKLFKIIDSLGNATKNGGEKMYPNLRVVRGSASDNTDRGLKSVIGKIKSREGNFLKDENILLLVNAKNIREFDALSGRALITAINDSGLDNFNYIPLVEMAAIAFMSEIGTDIDSLKNLIDLISKEPVDVVALREMLKNRIITIIPKPAPLGYEGLRQLYERMQEVYFRA
ncbi:MAG: hypothetical protein HQL28_00850 [Candidatus Omnitrophica bacterium]|nr:hypothetical protein [Candidatus Omnitrophota bacterium]